MGRFGSARGGAAAAPLRRQLARCTKAPWPGQAWAHQGLACRNGHVVHVCDVRVQPGEASHFLGSLFSVFYFILPSCPGAHAVRVRGVGLAEADPRSQHAGRTHDGGVRVGPDVPARHWGRHPRPRPGWTQAARSAGPEPPGSGLAQSREARHSSSRPPAAGPMGVSGRGPSRVRVRTTPRPTCAKYYQGRHEGIEKRTRERELPLAVRREHPEE